MAPTIKSPAPERYIAHVATCHQTNHTEIQDDRQRMNGKYGINLPSTHRSVVMMTCTATRTPSLASSTVTAVDRTLRHHPEARQRDPWNQWQTQRHAG